MVSFLSKANDLRYNQKAHRPGAQTERQGDARPVRSLLGGKGLTGRVFFAALPIAI